jgi:hypothetical protein
LAHLAGPAVDDLDRLAGIVDEQALARRVRLAHGWRQPALPGAIELAPAAVAVAAGFGGAVLLPEQHERDAGTAQLAVHMGPVWLGLAPEALLGSSAGVEHCLQHALAQPVRPRPGEPGRGDALEGERNRAPGHAQGPRDRPVAGAACVLEAQDLPYTSHRHSLGWHRLPRPSLARDGQEEAASPPSGRAITPKGGRLQIGMADIGSESVADFISESVAGLLRNQQFGFRRRARKPREPWRKCH